MKYVNYFLVALFAICAVLFVYWQREQLQQVKNIQSSKETVSNLQDSIQALKNDVASLQDSVKNILAKNLDLDVQMQLNNMREKVDTYQKFVSDTTNNMHDDMSNMLTKLAIIMAIFGVAFPLYFNHRSEKYMEKLLEDAKDKAEKAENALNDLQPKVKKAEDVVTTIEELKGNVVETTKKAKAIQFFIQALQENDENRAIALYDKCINEDKEFAEAYNNRGFLRHKIGSPDAKKVVKEDYTTAIDLFKNQGRGIYAEAYNNRGILYFENNDLKEAENDFNAAISKDYAEANLNLGLLKYAKGELEYVNESYDKAIELKPNFAEAYYIRGLFIVSHYWHFKNGIEDIIKAKDYKPNVIEAYPNRNLLIAQMKEWDDSFYRVEYSRDFKTLIRVPEDKEGNFKIPSSVTEIGERAFWGCSSLTSIKIPDSVTKIEWDAIRGCSSLTEIHLKHTSPVDFSDAFRGLDQSKITLYVPKGSGEEYRNHRFYRRFKEIIEEL